MSVLSRPWHALGLVLGILLLGNAPAVELEQPHLTLAVGGQGLFYYLPLTIAAQRGYFKAEGLEVTLADFPGGAKSMQAVVGGSADVAAGSFEHLLRLQAKGQSLRAVALLARYPALVLALSRSAASRYQDWPDLRGMKIGVTAPGSSTHLFLNLVLAQHGLAPEDVSVIGVGAGPGALGALRRGDVDGIVHLDPLIHTLEEADGIKVLVDTRSEAGAKAVYGGSYHASCLYATEAFIAQHPATLQALVDAQVKALRWLQHATVDEIVDSVPNAFWGGDRAGYAAALAKNLAILSPDGALPREGAEHVLAALTRLDPELAHGKVDVDAAVDTRFLAHVPVAAP